MNKRKRVVQQKQRTKMKKLKEKKRNERGA